MATMRGDWRPLGLAEAKACRGGAQWIAGRALKLVVPRGWEGAQGAGGAAELGAGILGKSNLAQRKALCSRME